MAKVHIQQSQNRRRASPSSVVNKSSAIAEMAALLSAWYNYICILRTLS